MLIKVTNFCSMGCSHCMEDSVPSGSHMTEEMFQKCLNFTERIEKKAWFLGCPPWVLLSGGECTEHPDIVKLVEAVIIRNYIPILISNGMWLDNKELKESLLRKEWTHLSVQVTNDVRFYPKKPPIVDDPRIIYVDAINGILPLGRAKNAKDKPDAHLKKAPSSFNLRSLTRSLKSFEEAVTMLRMRASSGMAGFCSPSITHEGYVMAGETRNCFKIGTVDSSNEELTKALIEMKCNKCGLENNLSPEQKRAIGASVLFGPNE